jgi:hypothetical protein
VLRGIQCAWMRYLAKLLLSRKRKVGAAEAVQELSCLLANTTTCFEPQVDYRESDETTLMYYDVASMPSGQHGAQLMCSWEF